MTHSGSRPQRAAAHYVSAARSPYDGSLVVVAYDARWRLVYTIEDLENGTLCCAREAATGRVEPRQWASVYAAITWLANPASVTEFTTEWVNAKPLFDEHGILRLPSLTAAVPLTPYQEYYRALELDIG